MTSALAGRIERLCDIVADADDRPAIGEIRRRLGEPMRVAIAGRINAGKSTLLNALVGECLAATDASECTLVPTWYRHDLRYDVTAVRGDGTALPVSFTRGPEGLSIDLDGLDPASLQRIVVSWPAARLEAMSLIDTPGTGSARPVLDRADHDHPVEADAVVYLLRYLHERDIHYLEAFGDRSLGEPSPVTAIALVSRADDIAGGSDEALDAASAIAARYRADPRIRSLAGAVLPVAGLLAETAATFREDEARMLRDLAALPTDELTPMLLSVDRFVDPERSAIPPSGRRALVARLGMFGIRRALEAFAEHPQLTAVEMSAMLRELSGIDELHRALTGIARRARALQARTALEALGRVADEIRTADPSTAALVRSGVEEIWMTAEELAALRLWEMANGADVGIDDETRGEVARLTSTDEPALALGVAAGIDLTSAALERIDHWRERAAHPLTTRPEAEICEQIAREYERIYGGLTGGR